MVYIATYTEKKCISFSKISLRIVKVCYKNTAQAGALFIFGSSLFRATLNRTEL